MEIFHGIVKKIDTLKHNSSLSKISKGLLQIIEIFVKQIGLNLIEY